MSLLIGGISKDGILMCGDTRVSTEILGTRYKVSDDFRKVHIVDNQTIMFTAGRTEVCSDIINRFKETKNKDTNTLVEIAKECICDFVESGGTGIDGHFVQIVLGKYEDEKFNIYLAEDSHNWEIRKVEGGDSIIPFTGGCREDEAMDLWDKLNEKISAEGRTASFESVACAIYNELSGEEIGGFMTAVFLQKDGVSEKIYAIEDSRKVKRVIKTKLNPTILNDIMSKQDCLIQGELRVGMGGNNAKGISFYGTTYEPDVDGNYSKPYARILPWVDAYDDHITGINVDGGKLCVNSVEVATQNDIKTLNRDIEKMQTDIKRLIDMIEKLK